MTKTSQSFGRSECFRLKFTFFQVLKIALKKANSADLDEVLYLTVSHLGLHCLLMFYS